VVRQTVVGTRDEALAALRKSCRELTSSGGSPEGPTGPAEQQFLESLTERPAQVEGPGDWQIHELKGGFPMVVGTRIGGDATPSGERTELAHAPRRVVTWGLGVPTQDQSWSLYTFHPTHSRLGPWADPPEIPLPPGSRSTLSMQVVGGGRTVAFAGPLEEGAWKEHFDRWSADHDWAPVGRWGRSGSFWHRRYVRSGGFEDQAVDVQFGPDGRGRARGLLMMTTGQTQAQESES
jgi:hypothetical protein